MYKAKRLVLMLVCSLLHVLVWAQNDAPTTDIMRSEGKIYVVMAVVVTIVLGIFLYLLNLDRKIKKLENKG